LPSLFSELKRRNVVRVGTAYALVAWLIAQAGDLAADNLSFPDWFMPMLLVVLVLGFPIAMFFAWAFELTPDGVKKTEEVDRDASITPSTGRRLNVVIIAALVLAVVLLLGDRFRTPSTTVVAVEQSTAQASAPEKSIAVLPFSNLSTDKSTDSFVSGLHDDLLTQLSKVNDLKVISRTSVLSYAGTTRNIKDIADELGVATVMEGGIQRAGDRVRINVQLIDSETDEHIWAETYDRVLTTDNVFDIQSEITRHIATALQAALTPAEEAGLADRPTDSLAAYEAYLESRQLIQQQEGGFSDLAGKAIAAGKLSVELDPDFAEAWAQLGYAYLAQFWYLSRDPSDANAARAAIDRARILKPESTEVGLVLSVYHYWANLDYTSALTEVDRVLALESGNAEAWATRGWILRRAGRWSEALDALQRSAVLDPNSAELMLELGDTLRVLDHFREAAAWQEAVERRLPDNLPAQQLRARLTMTTTGDATPLLTHSRSIAASETTGLNERVDYVQAEAQFGDGERALEYLDQWAPGTSDVQYQYWPEDLLRAYVLHYSGRAGDASDFAAKAMPVIEAAQRLEPNEADIESAKALALAIMGRPDEALVAAKRVRELYPRSLDDWGGGNYLMAATEVLAIAGHDELALAWLDDYMSGNGADMTLIHVRQLPAFKKLADTPAFAALVEKYGLVPADKSPPQ
jgi:TolB-like protein/Flp pilus assembly protein TadD